jgi:hypothetical protein
MASLSAGYTVARLGRGPRLPSAKRRGKNFAEPQLIG